LGAPIINSNGRLIGIITADSQGKHVLASAISDVIASVTSKPGPLMTKWQEGLAAYYATPAQYAQAQAAFSGLQSSYSDFGGVAPFLTAAQHQSASIAPLVQGTPTASGPGASSSGQGQASITPGNLALLIGLIVAAAVLVLGVLLALVVRARSRRAARAAYAIPPDEVGLSLLPRESMYAPTSQMMLGIGAGMEIEDVPTGQMPAVPSTPRAPAPAMVDIDEMPTLAEVMRAGPTGPRKTTSLVPVVAGKTDPGVRRASEPNQDNIFAIEGIRLAGNRPQPYGFFVVADGMGGHEHGREASAAVIQVYAQVVGDGLRGQQPLDAHTLTHLLRHGIQRAHEELRRRNIANKADMGTTITAALVVDDMAYVANVGDSRTYLMSPDTGLRQVTTDHSIVASLAAAGVIRPEEIYTHPRRNQIYRSLGGEQPEVEIDTFTTALQAGDKLLLCSDGLWEMVRDPQIEHILRATADPRQAVELLVREANANGGEDNISAVVARMVEEMPEHAQPSQRILFAPDGMQPHW
jgi:serine/threonine protein phosphatase PrpC